MSFINEIQCHINFGLSVIESYNTKQHSSTFPESRRNLEAPLRQMIPLTEKLNDLIRARRTLGLRL